MLNLLEACELFLDFRRDVVRRRTAFELRKAEARAHVLEGYVIALDHLDEVIALIRAARTPEVAKDGLVARFALTEIQAEEILKLQLQRLTGLERQKIVDELAELRVRDRRPQGHPGLAEADRRRSSPASSKALRDAHGEARRTEIVGAADRDRGRGPDRGRGRGDLDHPHRLHQAHARSPATARRSAGGRGPGGDEDAGTRTSSRDLFIASTHSYILIFTNRGRIYWLKVHEVPDVGPQGKGKAVVNLVSLQAGEKIAAFCAVRDFGSGGFVLLATRRGIVKKTELAAFSNPRPSGIIALSVEEDDQLIAAVLTSGKDEILLGTAGGHGHPLLGGGRAADGPHRLRGQGDRARRGGRGREPGGGPGRGHRPDRHPQRLRQADRPSTSTASRAGAARGSSTSRRPSGTAPWSG